MKVRTPPPERRRVTVARPDGSTFETTQTVEFAPQPEPPRDWDLLSTRAAVGMVLALTAVAVAWSTWSIGGLLHGGLGYLAALVFDLSWGTALILEWKARFDPDKRAFPQVLGWGLLAVTMGAIFWHAWPDLRYAVVGAVVSGVAKILWLGIMKHIEVSMTQRDRDDLRDRTSRANVRMAFASVDRAALRTEAHTAAVRRSLEGARPTVLELSASTQDTDPAELASAGEQFAEQIASTGEHPEPVREQIANTASTPPPTSTNTDRERPNMAAIVREQIANTASNAEAIANVLAIIPEANPGSVGAAVRRERRKAGPYL
ncbi:DUF2637 domain-containing protein [Streptomyces canus]|uniref:DUF2637 domain-containing protein n=1 Tax=Streptomyces canus TaxID=58343 RepID=UPI002E2CADB6|nr:DUF2637 domain-containing protein [Streptomyces canus]